MASIHAPPDLHVELLRREPALEALREEPMGKRALAEEIDVSEATAHRILATFREAGVVERTPGGNLLTDYGRFVADAATRYHERVEAASRLEPLLTVIDAGDVEFEVGAFADATVTVSESIDPYAPLNRFVELLLEAPSIRGLDVVSVSPTYAEEIHERIVDGLPVDVVYEPAVLERLVGEYPDLAEDALGRENLTVSTHDDLPFGLCLFGDRVGVGGHSPETGFLEVFVDTDDPDAVAWGERVFERYRGEATEL